MSSHQHGHASSSPFYAPFSPSAMLEDAGIGEEDAGRLQNGLEEVISGMGLGELIRRLRSLRVDPKRYRGLEKVR